MFTVFYFGFSSGMVYNVHYCLDQILVSAVSSSETCDICDTEDKNDCCSSEVNILKTDVAQKADITFVNDAPLAILLPTVSFADFFKQVFPRNESAIYVKAPPDKPQLSLFITHCNFRI